MNAFTIFLAFKLARLSLFLGHGAPCAFARGLSNTILA